MEDLQTASQVKTGQFISINSHGQWTAPAEVLHVQHNRLCGRTPRGEQVRGVVVVLADDSVASMDDDTIVKIEIEVAHA